MEGDYTTALKLARPETDILPQELDVRVTMEYAGKQHTVQLQRRRTIFGRGDADVVVEDPTMSRKHFQIEVMRSGVVLHDLASANGTIYRGRWSTYIHLKDSDTFQAGDTRFRIAIRTTNLVPARLLAVVALDGEEASALARLLDSGDFAIRSVDSSELLGTCRSELPELVLFNGAVRELGILEQLKRMPRLRATHVIALLPTDDPSLRERFEAAGAETLLQRPVSTQSLQVVIDELVKHPLELHLNLPATLRIVGHGEFQTRLTSLSVREARLRIPAPVEVESETAVRIKLMLPNEYGVVQAQGVWQGSNEDIATVRLTAYEGNGQLVVRRILRDMQTRGYE